MKSFTILGVLALLVAGVGYYMIFYVPTDEMDVTSVLKSQEVVLTEDLLELQKTERTGYGTLADLQTWGEDLECTIFYENEVSETSAEGTLFISGEKIRVDSLTDSSEFEETLLSSMIMDGDNMYIWSEIEGELYGMKMSVSDINKPEFNNSETISFYSDVKYNCSNWTEVDATVFVPPSDVLFQSMEDILKGAMEYGTVYEEGSF